MNDISKNEKSRFEWCKYAVVVVVEVVVSHNIFSHSTRLMTLILSPFGLTLHVLTLQRLAMFDRRRIREYPSD